MTGGEEELEEMGSEIFRPILPMHASTTSDVIDAMSGFELSAGESRLD